MINKHFLLRYIELLKFNIPPRQIDKRFGTLGEVKLYNILKNFYCKIGKGDIISGKLEDT